MNNYRQSNQTNMKGCIILCCINSLVWFADIALTSDFILGFCGESHEAYMDTVSLIKEVGYSYIYCFAYSMRKVNSLYR